MIISNFVLFIVYRDDMKKKHTPLHIIYKHPSFVLIYIF